MEPELIPHDLIPHVGAHTMMTTLYAARSLPQVLSHEVCLGHLDSRRQIMLLIILGKDLGEGCLFECARRY